jgi:hypothetical protein
MFAADDIKTINSVGQFVDLVTSDLVAGDVASRTVAETGTTKLNHGLH